MIKLINEDPQVIKKVLEDFVNLSKKLGKADSDEKSSPQYG